MMDTNEKNMLWNAVAVDMLSTVQEFCGTGLKQKNWDGKSTRERKKTRLAAQCANRHTHTQRQWMWRVLTARMQQTRRMRVYSILYIYIYTTVHMHSRCGWARIDVPYLVVVGMYAVCVFCDGTWFMDSAGSALSMGDSGFDGARRLEWNRSDNEISGISYALSTIICIKFIHFEKVDQR